MDQSYASRTAVLVCQGRAAADGRIDAGRFDDPTAILLLTDSERAQVEVARSGISPQSFGERMDFERLRAVAEVMVPRTLAIDEAVMAKLHSQLVILGAGLDGRAWRMRELAEVDVFEVDHPASQAEKQSRLDRLEPAAKSIRFVPVDLSRDPLADALAAAGHDRLLPTTWIWEGVIPYLTRDEVEKSLGAIARISAPGSRLVISYQSRSFVATIGRRVTIAVAKVSGSDNAMAREPWRSTWTPATMKRLLTGHGFTTVSDEDLTTIVRRLSLTVGTRRSSDNGRVFVADR
jgi:methyltransferase (TIGR00027 family)